jgi:hypothetical protein
MLTVVSALFPHACLDSERGNHRFPLFSLLGVCVSGSAHWLFHVHHHLTAILAFERQNFVCLTSYQHHFQQSLELHLDPNPLLYVTLFGEGDGPSD